MKLIATLITVTGLLFLSGCSRKPIYKSEWQSSPLAVGEFSEKWQTNMQYNTKASMLYSVTNDDKYLYVSLKVTDKTVQRKIMLTGLTFWIDNTGKGKKQLGLIFPIKQRRQMNHGKISITRSEKLSADELQRFNDRYYNGMSEILLAGFYGEDEPELRGNKSISGINAILWMDSLQALYYEAQIPLDMIFEKPEEYLNNSTKYFSYAFETGYIEMPSMSSGGRVGGMSGKGSGSRGGGSGRGGNRPSGMNSETMAAMQEMSQSSKFHVKKAFLSNDIK